MDECIIDILLKMNLDIEEIKKSVCRQEANQSKTTDKELVDNEEVCKLLKCSKKTLARYRAKGLIPYYEVEGKKLYNPNEIKDYLKKKYYGS